MGLDDWARRSLLLANGWCPYWNPEFGSVPDGRVVGASSILKQVTAIFTQKCLGVCLPGRVTCVLNGQPTADASVDDAEKLEQRVLGWIVIT